MDRSRALSRDLFADRVYQVYRPEMRDLSLQAGDRSVQRCDKWEHDVIPPVCLQRAMGEAHALIKSGFLHFLLARSDTDAMVAFVQDDVTSSGEETQSAE